MITKKTTTADRLNLYIWFPFKLRGFGEVQFVILLDEWVFENNGRFSENAHLYMRKLKNFNELPFKVGTAGIDPYVIVTEYYTQSWQYCIQSNRLIGFVS